KKICQSRGYMASIVPLEPLQPGTSLLDAARSIVEGVLHDLPYTVDRFKKLVDFFDSLGISVLGTGLQFKRNTSKVDISTQAFLRDTLTELWQALKDKTEIFVILLDDLDNFIAVPEILMALRQTLTINSVMESKIIFGISASPEFWINITSTDNHHPIS